MTEKTVVVEGFAGGAGVEVHNPFDFKYILGNREVCEKVPGFYWFPALPEHGQIYSLMGDHIRSIGKLSERRLEDVFGQPLSSDKLSVIQHNSEIPVISFLENLSLDELKDNFPKEPIGDEVLKKKYGVAHMHWLAGAFYMASKHNGHIPTFKEGCDEFEVGEGIRHWRFRGYWDILTKTLRRDACLI